MTLQAYQITRKGPKHFRMEHADAKGEPTGKPWLGSLTKRNATGGYEKNGNHVLVGYGMAEGMRDVIRCTPEEAAKLAHMKLVPIVGGKRVDPLQPAETSKPDGVHVPEDWHSMSAKERKELAALIAGRDEDRRVRDADAIIEAYVKEQNGGGKANTD